MFTPYVDNHTNVINPSLIGLIAVVTQLLFSVQGFGQLIYLVRYRKSHRDRCIPFSFKKLTIRNYGFIFVYALLIVVHTTLLIAIDSHNVTLFDDQPVIYYMFLGQLAYTTVVLVPTYLLELYTLNYAISNQILYSLFFTILYIFQCITNTEKYSLLSPYDTNQYVQYSLAVLHSSLAVLLTTSYKPVQELTKLYDDNGWFKDYNFLVNITFVWLNPLLTETHKLNYIKDPENLPMPPINLDIRFFTKHLRKNWESQKWSGKKSLMRALWSTFGKIVLISVTYETVKDLLTIAKPLLLRSFIKSFNSDEFQDYPPLHSFLISMAIFSIDIFSIFLTNQFYIIIFEAGLGIRGSLAALVYQKSLKLSLESRNEAQIGDILNMASVDVLRIQKFFEDAQTLIGSPIQIIVGLLSLYFLLREGVFAGITVMVIMVPINSLLSRKLKALSKTQMKYKDSRIKTVSEILNSIKSIKLYAWEKPMLKRLFHIRNDLELENLKKIGVMSNFISFAWNSVPLLVTCSTFMTFALMTKIPLTPEIVFPALSLFNILNSAIYSIPSMITRIIETSVSVSRLKHFLLLEELDNSFIERSEAPEDDTTMIVRINNATFLWKSPEKIQNEDDEHGDSNTAGELEQRVESTQLALKSINNFDVPKGSLICIVGRVGSGKSTFLKSILGQLPCISGDQGYISPSFQINATSIAYCPQEAWIMNATVKENILFGHKYDEDFYNATVKACQLEPDIKVLPDGDDTMVGEKGIVLSGGQKTRLSLARAVYSRADLYLLDDILSAVDTEVCKTIIKEVLHEKTGLLKDKTIILSTNTVSVLKHSTRIYLLENKTIVESGGYDELMRNSDDSKLKSLIHEFDLEKPEFDAIQEGTTDKSVMNVLLNDNNSDIDIDDENTEINERNMMKLSTRRASMVSLKAIKHFSDKDLKKKTNQQDEKMERGRVKNGVYITYMKACGYIGVLLFFLFLISTRCFDLLQGFWLKYWSESNLKNEANLNLLWFLGVYALIGVGGTFCNNMRSITMLLYGSLKGSKTLHNRMAESIMRSPMSFFETTPTGRIINRFSSDIDSVDTTLQNVFSMFFMSILDYVITVILVTFNMPTFFIMNACLLVVYIYYQSFYIVLSRELKRLTSISYSPIMSLMGESLSGHYTISAYEQIERFYHLNYEKIQFSINCFFNYRSSNRWLSVRLQSIGALIVLITGLLALSTLGTKKQLSSGMVGLLMSYALKITQSLIWIVRSSVLIETNIVSVERIVEYCNINSEAPDIIEGKRVEQSWPSQGIIHFKNYSTTYRETLDPVLKNINLEIKSGEKIGVVGRTGAGKSTLSMALFRLLEPLQGTIIIDGVDITKIGLMDLRSHIAIIPQDAQAFEGTIRSNLDPFGDNSDSEIWKAVGLSHLKPHIESIMEELNKDASITGTNTISSPLDIPIREGGGNLSVGQKQLLCLARALLNKSKVLVLDEATAAVDLETDKIIQETIRKEFADRTILTVAHRLDTVLDSDRIVVLDNGEVKEFGSPDELLEQKDSIFYKLCEQGGYLKNRD
ncbi:hypothetical protein RNJ44_00250 [Nakaseomyces bracarensis]|uniref:Bile pigment transporter 1 n=1 Tax=Nakaseomyces bracarensis TaxID=273131 RepID=A0ABR4NTB5_9SACH